MSSPSISADAIHSNIYDERNGYAAATWNDFERESDKM